MPRPTRHIRFFAGLICLLTVCGTGLLVRSARAETPDRLATSSKHTCVVTSAGGVKCWGWNRFGQLGDGTGVTRSIPADVMGLTSGVVGVSTSAGGRYTCALTNTQGVKCWGENFYGALGDGTEENRDMPVDVVGLTSGVVSIATGWAHTCAVMSTGGVKCWGKNNAGQLGNGTASLNAYLTPVDVVGLTSSAVSVTAGFEHTCALMVGGSVKCWGNNAYGQLGNGSSSSVGVSTPGNVSGLASGVVSLKAGGYHTCAVTSTEGMKCWGNNAYGQLGNGTTSQRVTPADVLGLTSGVASIATGAYHTCAVTTGGGVKCWGRNEFGRVGDGTTENRWTPVDVVGLTSGMRAVAGGETHTCALTSTGSITCWGENDLGQLGNGAGSGSITPVAVAGLTAGVLRVSAGNNYACIVTGTNGVKCWGESNQVGQLGNGTPPGSLSPVDVVGLTSGVARISAGVSHACAVTNTGGVKCWGWNANGQLGDGTTENRWTPVDVVGWSSGIRDVAAGESHTCAVTTGGGVKCWGNNDMGQLGDGTTTNSATPVDVVGLTSGVASISAGSHHTCAITSTGGVRCWGFNGGGQLGDDSRTNRSAPVDVVGLTDGMASVSAGNDFSCAVTNGGGVKCWGSNDADQLGSGTSSSSATPVDVVGLASGVASVNAGIRYACAVTNGGGVKCWGINNAGQLGDGTTTNSQVPVDVVGLASGVASVSAGSTSTVALTSTNGVQRWGAGERYSSIPVEVMNIVALDAASETRPRPTPGLRLTLLGQRAVRLDGATPGAVTVRLYDVLGRVQAVVFAGAVGETVTASLPLGLSPGVYVVAAEVGTERASRVLVVR